LRYEGVEKIARGPLMDVQAPAQAGRVEWPGREHAKYVEFDRAQQHLRGPEAHRGLHDPVISDVGTHAFVRYAPRGKRRGHWNLPGCRGTVSVAARAWKDPLKRAVVACTFAASVL
jgi:hypothetical protein